MTAACPLCGKPYLALRAQQCCLLPAAQATLGLCSWEMLCLSRYVRPEFVSEDQPPQLRLIAARHPVLDVVSSGQMVPNDIELSGDGCRVQLITGPNMGGKSTVIRQAALIAIMAQVCDGTDVPVSQIKSVCTWGQHAPTDASVDF